MAWAPWAVPGAAGGVATLRAFGARHDLKESVRKDIAIATLELHTKALAWLVAADPTLAAALRVQPDAVPIQLTCPLARPECPANPLPVPPRKSDR